VFLGALYIARIRKMEYKRGRMKEKNWVVPSCAEFAERLELSVDVESLIS
jgi:hypothetical protein